MNLEKTVETITHSGVIFEVVERPEVFGAGKVAYAPDFNSEPDFEKLLKEYQGLMSIPMLEPVTPDWSAAISIDYCREGVLCGMMYGAETYTDEQDERYDLYKMPASLFIRVQNNADAAKLLGKELQGAWELFGVIKEQIMYQHGYKFNDNGAQEIEYSNHKDGTQYVYVPVVKI